MSENQELIRVAHIMGSICRGGVESVVFNYYRVIDRNRIQFDFIIDDDSPREIPDDILALGCNVYKIPSYKRLRAYTKTLKQILPEYKIVHSHMNTLSVFPLYAAKRAGVPVRIAHSLSTAGRGNGEFLRNVMKYLLRPLAQIYPTHLLTCGEYAGRWLFGDKAYDSGKVTIIPNVIDVSKFRFNPDIRERVRIDLGVDSKLVVGHIGRFVHQKNHGFLIKVFKEIYKLNSSTVLLLVGDGELRQEIEQMVIDFGLQSAVLFLGLRDDYYELYQAMDVFVLPSLYEGLPVVGVEAQCAGLPCVMSDRVTEEVSVDDSVLFLSLEIGTDKWVQNILKQAQLTNRDQKSEVYCSRWDVKANTGRLTDIYEQAVCDIMI